LAASCARIAVSCETLPAVQRTGEAPASSAAVTNIFSPKRITKK
jgi:hypothetical protein